ncbi:unnamed protein product, partial [Effrenium voratum]
LLKAALSPFMEEWQPLLLLDVAPAHLGQGFMALAQCAPEALHKPLKRLLGEQTALLSCGEKPQPEDMQHVWPKRRRMLY